MFTLLVCADLFGSKVNLEVTFPALPTIAELTRRCEEVFNSEMHAIRPPGASVPAEGFRANRVQIYDDVLLKWVDLISSTQLHEYDQVYAFQPQTHWQVDTQQDLPAPRPPTNAGLMQSSIGMRGEPAPPPPAAAWSPQPVASAPAYGVAQPGVGWSAQQTGPVPGDDKVRAVFDAADQSRKGYMEYAEMERVFRERGLDFSANTVGELFYKADLNRDGRVTLEEWSNWARIYPNTLECLYFRGLDTPEEAGVRQQVQQAYNQIASNQSREQQIRSDLEAMEAQNRELRDAVARGQAAAAELAQRKQTLDPQERELVEEEIKLERQRDQMRMSQARFQEASDRFNRNHASKGSPRRARDVVPGY